MPPKKERKTKPPDDPTIMVGGQPKIDLNATKLQINEFLKRHKVIKPSDGGKRKSLTKLREELKAGGHVVGVEGKTGTVSKGNTLSKLQRAEKTKKEAEYKQLIASNPQGFNVKNTINILGFKNAPIPPKPSAAEIELSGYGGMPINYSPPASTVSSFPDISQGVRVDEMRFYLSGRIPNTAFKDLNKRDLRELYNETKEKENEPDLDDFGGTEEAVEEPQIETDSDIDDDDISEQDLDEQEQDDLDLLEMELEDGDITQEEYEEKKRTILYLTKQKKKKELSPEQKERRRINREKLKKVMAKENFGTISYYQQPEPEPFKLTEEDIEELINKVEDTTRGFRSQMVAYEELARAGIIVDKPVRPELRKFGLDSDEDSDYEAANDQGDDDL